MKNLKEIYHRFIKYLLRFPLNNIPTRLLLRLCYYLILQDRIEDSLTIYDKINRKDIETQSSNIHSFSIQYDYLTAYLYFYRFNESDTEKLNEIKSICEKYIDFPLLYWRDLFREIKELITSNESENNQQMIIDEENERKLKVMQIVEKAPKLSFTLKDKKSIEILFNNLSEITINFYFINIEILFSRNPFIQQNTDNFLYVNPNFTNKIKTELNHKEQVITYEIPEIYQAQNFMIEVNGANLKCFETYFSSNLRTSIVEDIGEIKVMNDKFQSLPKVYVKVFSQFLSGEVKFYKDGYTDIKGKFNYIQLNNIQLSSVSKFSILVIHETLGSIIKTCDKPQNLKNNYFLI